MKKPFRFDQLDNDITCPLCEKPLKKNVLARVTENVLTCFKCWTKSEYLKDHILNDKALAKAGITKVVRPYR